MKVGRLKSNTLTSILRSVGITSEEKSELASAIPPPCKYYIPTSANNPLYGTFSINPHMAVASAAMAASNPNHSPQVDTPAVGSAPSPILVLSPETTLAIQAASATRENADHIGHIGLQNRGSRWSSFIDNRTPPLSSTDDINDHRRTRSWPNGTNINDIQRISPLNVNIPSIMEDRERSNDSEFSSPITGQPRSSGRLSFHGSQSLDNISIPLLPSMPNLDQLSLDKDNSEKSWLSEFEHINIDWSMKTMDTIYSASFYAYIRDEKNVDLASIRLSRIIKDYKPRQVAFALRWLTQGWSVENTSRLLRNVFMDWLPDLAACVFTLMSKDWPARPQLSLCCAYLLINEPPAIAAVFLRTLTSNWKKNDSIELISYLDGLLEWDQPYFHELMSVYTEQSRENKSIGIKKLNSIESKSQKYQDQVLSYLSTMYNKGPEALNGVSSASELRTMMTGLNLSLVSHYINCDACQNQEHCDIARMLITSISSSEGICSTNYNSQLELNDRMSSSAPELSARDRSTSEIANVRNSFQTIIENHTSMYNPPAESEPEKSNDHGIFDNE